jgi:hypothetical protein
MHWSDPEQSPPKSASMHPREVEFLRRLIAERPQSRKLNGSATLVAEREGVGTIRGAAVYYEPADLTKASNILKTRGFPLEIPTGAFARSEAPAGGSEKNGALRVSSDMVAVVPINVGQYTVHNGGFLALPLETALSMPYEVLLVCENMEPLRCLGSYQWLQRYFRGRPALALFRGAPGFFRTDVAAEFMRRDTRPVLGFFDFDPKGLSMAAAVPRLEALCLPAPEALKAAVLLNRRGHLFTNSYSDCRKHLDSITQSEIAEAWRDLKRLQIGLDQEHFPR